MMDAAVTVCRVLSQRLGGCIFVGRLADDRELKVVAAASLMAALPVPGELWRVRGQLEDSRWGRQLRAEALWRAAPSGKLLGDWVVANVPGIGRTKADRLMAAFGAGLADVLDHGDPEPLVEVLAPAHPNLGARLACSLVALWQEQRVSADIHAWLDRHGVQEPRLAQRLAELAGENAIAALENNPYTLVGLLPWKQVDALGLRLLAEENDQPWNPAQDARRLVGAVDAVVVERITEHGDTAVADKTLRRRLAELLRDSLPAADLPATVADGTAWRAPGCALMETLLGHKVNDLVGGPWRSVILQRPPDALQSLLEAACIEEDIRLHPEQEAACTRLLGLPLGVLTGGAGVARPRPPAPSSPPGRRPVAASSCAPCPARRPGAWAKPPTGWPEPSTALSATCASAGTVRCLPTATARRPAWTTAPCWSSTRPAWSTSASSPSCW